MTAANLQATKLWDLRIGDYVIGVGWVVGLSYPRNAPVDFVVSFEDGEGGNKICGTFSGGAYTTVNIDPSKRGSVG